MMDMQAIVDDWRANAEDRFDRNFRFIHGLKAKSGNAVDRVAHSLHAEAFSIIDCTRCANCCKTCSPQFRQSDIRRIAERLSMTADEFKSTYLAANEDGDVLLKTMPCLFLRGDDHCTIYDVRPRDCAEYPHTQKKGFTYRTHSVASNSLTCPAVYFIIEQMQTR